MIKRFIYSLLVLLTVTFSSCKKFNEDYHRVRFHIEFINGCEAGFSNFIEVDCKPDYSNDEPVLPLSVIEPGYEWDYEFWQLKDGDEVKFSVLPQQGYRFIMSVYVDEELVSYREVQGVYGGYYGTVVLDQGGINNADEDNMGIIEFIYYE